MNDLTKSERWWTQQSGELYKRLQKVGLVWVSFPDSGRRQFHKIGADGHITDPPLLGIFCEVKKGNEELTQNQIDFAKFLQANHLNLWVIRIYEDEIKIFWHHGEPIGTICDKALKALNETTQDK